MIKYTKRKNNSWQHKQAKESRNNLMKEQEDDTDRHKIKKVLIGQIIEQTSNDISKSSNSHITVDRAVKCQSKIADEVLFERTNKRKIEWVDR